MPQFDVFLFFSSVFYLLIGFFSIMIYNQFFFLPKVSALLKLREKLFNSKRIPEYSIKNEPKKVVKLSNSLN